MRLERFVFSGLQHLKGELWFAFALLACAGRGFFVCGGGQIYVHGENVLGGEARIKLEQVKQASAEKPAQLAVA